MNFLRQGFRKLSHYSLEMRAFSYAWALPVTWKRWRSHYSIRHIRYLMLRAIIPHGSIFYRSRVMTGWIFTLREYAFFYIFLLLWPWPWSDDLNIPTWPVFPGDIQDVQIWTSYVKAFESYRLTHIYTQRDRQTDTTEIIHHDASREMKEKEQNWV